MASDIVESIKVLGVTKTIFYRTLYRPLMRLAHRFNWHYAPITTMANGDTHQWCKWCGLRQVHTVFRPSSIIVYPLALVPISRELAAGAILRSRLSASHGVPAKNALDLEIDPPSGKGRATIPNRARARDSVSPPIAGGRCDAG